MDVFLTTLKAVIDGLGATIALPIIIFFVALVLGAKPGKAFRAGVVIGIAFIGINLVIGLMWGSLSEVGQALVKNLGITRDVISGNTGEPKSTNGHIDILSRHKSGRGGRTKLCIWELKQPRTYKKAAAQAYIYAYALLKVIRDSRSGSEWYKVYGFNSVVPKKLEIEAVVAITRDQKENYEREISILKKKASFEIEGDLITLYPAYYEEKHNSIILTNNPFEE